MKIVQTEKGVSLRAVWSPLGGDYQLFSDEDAAVIRTGGKAQIECWLTAIALEQYATLEAALAALPAEPCQLDGYGPQWRAVPVHEQGAAFAILPKGRDAGVSRCKCDFRDHVESLPQCFRMGSSEYHGVLFQNAAGRLVVSPHGKMYVWQTPAGSSWTTPKGPHCLSKLLPKLPADAAAFARAELPEDPLKLPRPWADEAARVSDLWRVARPGVDDYRGEIARHGSIRVSTCPCGSQVWLQSLDPDGGWRFKRAAPDLGAMSRCVVPDDQPFPDLSGFVVRSSVLADAIAARLALGPA